MSSDYPKCQLQQLTLELILAVYATTDDIAAVDDKDSNQDSYCPSMCLSHNPV